MVYMSPLFQRNHPEKTEKIRNAEDREFCTDKFIFVVMDVEGIKFADNDDVHKYSLFSANE